MIAGDNVGRNLIDGTDRISLYGELNEDNWPLASCFGSIVSQETYTDAQIFKDAKRFEEYLRFVCEKHIHPHKGSMVYLGHPLYTAYSDTTLIPLESILEKAKKDNAWLASLGEIADYWNSLDKLVLHIEEFEGGFLLHPEIFDDTEIKGLSLRTDKEPVSCQVKHGKCNILERDGDYYVIFDVQEDQELKVMFK